MEKNWERKGGPQIENPSSPKCVSECKFDFFDFSGWLFSLRYHWAIFSQVSSSTKNPPPRMRLGISCGFFRIPWKLLQKPYGAIQDSLKILEDFDVSFRLCRDLSKLFGDSSRLRLAQRIIHIFVKFEVSNIQGDHYKWGWLNFTYFIYRVGHKKRHDFCNKNNWRLDCLEREWFLMVKI